MLKTIRLILTFYTSFALASTMITLACTGVVYTWGIDTFTALFWFKLITLGLIVYYIHSFKKDYFYYYKNLGLTKQHLWVSALSIDLVLFLILTFITLKIR